MDNFMKSVLSRVLSQEIGNQLKWKESDIKNGYSDGSDRDDNIARIKQFMNDTGIEFRPDYL